MEDPSLLNNNQRIAQNNAFWHQALRHIAGWLCNLSQAEQKRLEKPSFLVTVVAVFSNYLGCGTGIASFLGKLSSKCFSLRQSSL
ncbi:MAG: hypothetical protein NWE93_01155 [Candidatus Bathyarchaeota archaeon]|nr:hypothetical protein [Candidatus Bathyarchaeota archaeon]